MAKAEKIEKKIIEKTITLTLSQEEAEALLAVVGRVTGSNDSPRKHTGAVYSALGNAGISGNARKYFEDPAATLHFRDTPRLYY
ncbi:hypothetical protein [Streptomyces antibioticus]|uniref:hypothetical protein n=1 Tax=Streptomyces antibioticus TaxID=1890 RepID=UPI0033DDF046